MNEAQQQLARRLVEHPAWRWMPGMRWIAIRVAPLDTEGEAIAHAILAAPTKETT